LAWPSLSKLGLTDQGRDGAIHLPRQEIDLDPQGLAKRSHSEYIVGKGLVEMIREDFVAERIAIESR
jgi:hypothetical protein